MGTLNYQYDSGGSLTNMHTGTAGGANVLYQYDILGRMTNVVDYGLSGVQNTGYGYDAVGNLQAQFKPQRGDST